jgi:hypothetical protein
LGILGKKLASPAKSYQKILVSVRAEQFDILPTRETVWDGARPDFRRQDKRCPFRLLIGNLQNPTNLTLKKPDLPDGLC